jgi:hypothetical protein
MAQAAIGGHRHVVAWLLSAKCPVDALATAAAMQGGQVGLLRWMRADKRRKHFPWDARVSCFAALRGDLPTLLWLRQQAAPWDGPAIVAAAAFGGHAALVQWLLAKGCECDERLAYIAGATGDVVVIATLAAHKDFEHERPFFSLVMETASRHGKLDAIAFLLERFTFDIYDPSFMGAAASAGRLAVLELLARQPAPLPTGQQQQWFNLLECGARSGNVSVVEWICQHMDISIWRHDPNVMAAAARSGSTEMLTYLADQGCFVDATAHAAAAALGDPRVIDWFHRQRQ